MRADHLSTATVGTRAVVEEDQLLELPRDRTAIARRISRSSIRRLLVLAALPLSGKLYNE